MRRLLLTILLALAALTELSAQADSTVRAALGARLEEYCSALTAESAEVKCGEADFMIDSCADPETRRFTAAWLYSRYFSSKVMGDDAVAIHIYDRWFAGEGLEMYSELEQLTADIFAEFNRRSLIGCRAPSFSVTDGNGTVHRLFEKPSGRVSVLYFYSTDCAKCRIENIMVRNVAENRDCPIDFYAVCTGGSRETWEETVSGSLAFSTSATKVLHLFDEGEDKEWQLLYGVLQTPKMFLIDNDGTIIGRGLDSYALDQLLERMFAPVKMVYGETASYDFYDGIFASYREENGRLDTSNLEAVAAHIAKRTLGDGDTTRYRQMTGDLLYYLNYQEDGALRRGIAPFCRKYVLDRGDIWKTADDSLQVVGLAMMLEEICSRAPEGEKLPAITVWGRKSGRAGDGRIRHWRLDRLPAGTAAVIFYSPCCNDCREQLEALSERLKADRRLKVLKVDIDLMSAEHPDEFGRMMDSFDLTVIPYITTLDGKGIVKERYGSFK